MNAKRNEVGVRQSLSPRGCSSNRAHSFTRNKTKYTGTPSTRVIWEQRAPLNGASACSVLGDDSVLSVLVNGPRRRASFDFWSRHFYFIFIFAVWRWSGAVREIAGRKSLCLSLAKIMKIVVHWWILAWFSCTMPESVLVIHASWYVLDFVEYSAFKHLRFWINSEFPIY
jgi:hypothetical protein